MPDGRLVHRLEGHTSALNCCAVLPGSERVVTGSNDGTVRLWDLVTGQEMLVLKTKDHAHCLAASPDGRWLAAGVGFEGRIQIWELKSLTPEERAARHARDAVQFWIERRLPKADARELVAKDEWLPDAVKRQAEPFIEAAEEEKSTEEYNAAAWWIVKSPHYNAVQQDIALRQAKAACRLKPDSVNYPTTLGIALYRNGRYQEAVATLENLAIRKGESDAFDLFFLAMSHFKLNNVGKAQDCFERANKWGKEHMDFCMEHSEEMVAFYKEAAELMVDKEKK